MASSNWRVARARTWPWLLVALSAFSIVPTAFAAESAQLSGFAGTLLDAGDAHTCGVIEDRGLSTVSDKRGLACWGRNTDGQASPPYFEDFIAVSAGDDHTCGLNIEGEAMCWGNPASIAISPPAGPFVAISAGQGESCALRPNGRVVCWGGALAAATPKNDFLSVSVAKGRACGIRGDGSLQCWRAAGVAKLGAEPVGRFLALSVSMQHACAVRSDGRVLCWGPRAQGAAPPTSMRYIAVTTGDAHSCAIREDGGIACWGNNSAGQLAAPSGRFTAITAGREHTCARGEDGNVRCWGGTNAYGERVAPIYNYDRLAVGRSQACGQVYLGYIDCIGTENALTPPTGRYERLSFGENTACGLGIDGRVSCWGESLGTPPNEPLSKISIGAAHVCGLRPNGAAVCWGDNTYGQATPPPTSDYESFSMIVSGDRFSCGLSGYSGLTCWGEGAAVTDSANQGLFASIGAYGRNLCAIDFSGAAHCWGEDAALLQSPLDPNIDPLQTEPLVGIAVGDRHVCGLRARDNSVVCWGDDSRGQLQAPTGFFYRVSAFGDLSCASSLEGMTCWGAQRFSKISPTVRFAGGAIAAGDGHTCSVRGDGTLGCWGDNIAGQRNPPKHLASAIAASGDHTCSLSANGQPVCWGSHARNGNAFPAGAMRTLDLGQFNGCAVRVNGEGACWGWNSNQQNAVPAALYRRIATGLNHSCGVLDDGRIRCWGYNADGQTAVGAARGHRGDDEDDDDDEQSDDDDQGDDDKRGGGGANLSTALYRVVDVGERHSCAIAINGQLKCWGLSSEGQTAPPAGVYRALASGSFHNCAIRADSRIVCWGRNTQGQATPPSDGRYIAIVAGAAHSCAIRDDGIRVCWGDNGKGQSPTLSIDPQLLPAATFYQPYLAQLSLSASGGYAPLSPQYFWRGGEIPSNITINQYGQVYGVAVTDPGTYTFTLEAVDGNGLATVRDFPLTIVPPPPEIEPVVDGQRYWYSEWYFSDVRISWNINAFGAEYTSSGCEPVVVNQDTDGVEFRCSVTSSSGTTERTVFIRRDATPMDTVFDEVPPPLTYAQGYVTSRFRFSAPAADNLSGFARFECAFYDFEFSYQPCESPYDVPVYPSSETRRLYVRAVDAAGNADPTPAVYEWRVQFNR